MPPAAPSAPSAPSSADVASQLASYNAHPVTSTDAMNQALSQYGVPEIRQTVSGLRQTVANTTNALNNVDPSVTGRTQGSLVTEAQRQKQVANERAPIAQQLTQQNQDLNLQQGDLNSALQEATTEADNKVKDYQAGETMLQNEFNDALNREKLAASSSANNDTAALMAALMGGSQSQSSQPTQPTANMVQRADKGFNYTDQNGNAINAAQYAHLTGQNFRDVLAKAAAAGDVGSKTALNFVGNDYGYDPTKVTSQGMADLYKALTGQNANVYNPASNHNIFTAQGAQNDHNAIMSALHTVLTNAGNRLKSNAGIFGL